MNIRPSVVWGLALLFIVIGAALSGGWNSFTRNMTLFSLGYAFALVVEEIEERNK